MHLGDNSIHWLLEILQCPITHERLHPATVDVVHELQELQQRGELHNRLGLVVEDELESGLVNESHEFFYVVTDNIPSLLPGEAIPISGTEDRLNG